MHCIWYNRDSVLSGKSGKDTLDESRVELEDNLQAKHFTLSAGGHTLNWVKRGRIDDSLI